ncbi:MAG: ATP-binding cassette domain-containing protein [Cyanobacteria bacterium]|nr:ATP-binding cassette domain-containing protein [Cyanobacteriota bacterium]
MTDANRVETVQSGADLSVVIRVHDLVKSYKKQQAVSGVTFHVNASEIFGLIGPDGAGKTSIFNILAGVANATAGDVTVLGRPPAQAKAQVAYLTQKFSLYPDLTVNENIEYSAGLQQIPRRITSERAALYLSRVGLSSFGNRLTSDLSGGMKQKLALCCALVKQPGVLLLDEPTTGVDPIARREFWDLLVLAASQGTTVMIATPYIDEAERCHRVGFISGGIIEHLGTPEQIKRDSGLHRFELYSSEPKTVEDELLRLKATGALDLPLVDMQTFGDRVDLLVLASESATMEQRLKKTRSMLGAVISRVNESIPTLDSVLVGQLKATQKLVSQPFPYTSAPQSKVSERDQCHIVAVRLSKKFGRFQAVENIDLNISAGEIFGLLGANGAGKTTVVKMLCGLTRPTQGAIMLMGEDDLRKSALRRRVGYMSQKFTLYDDLTIMQNLRFYAGVYGVPEIDRLEKISWILESCGLSGYENRLTGSLPGGWKQRIAFGACIMHEPQILFLDEPTSGVDPLARRQLWRMIEDLALRGTAILVTTHYLEEAEHCHRVAFMESGRIVAQGAPEQIRLSQPGHLFEISCVSVQKACQLIKSLISPWRVSVFADRIRVLLENPDMELLSILSRLRSSGIDVASCEPVAISLDDAFISIIQKAKSTNL